MYDPDAGEAEREANYNRCMTRPPERRRERQTIAEKPESIREARKSLLTNPGKG